MTSFGHRRRFLRRYRAASFRFDLAMWWLFEDVLGYQPRRTSALGLAVLFFHTSCPICFFLRGVALGAIAGAGAGSIAAAGLALILGMR